MGTARIHQYLTRLGRLLDAEERAGDGLQPVQLQALLYLARCNRYSDRPAAVAEYLGITKGTASQTLRVLERRGLVSKQSDTEDRRVVRLTLTPEGRRLSEEAAPRALLDQALGGLSDETVESLEAHLAELLTHLQRRHGGRSFGLCHTCRYFQKTAEGARCGLTREPLSVADSELLCREHEAP